VPIEGPHVDNLIAERVGELDASAVLDERTLAAPGRNQSRFTHHQLLFI
jgi:hypothetical protein